MNARDKLYEIDYIVKDIKKFPQTYETILQEFVDDGTCQVILRRKLNNLVKEGVVCRMVIPGTRHGKVLFFTHPKKYHILVETSRIGNKTFVFFKYEKLGKKYIKLSEYWELGKSEWKKRTKDKVVYDEEVIKWI